MKNNIYDLIILGAGPAGLTASIYASRYKIKHLVIGKLIGGTATEAFKVENWPGTADIPGKDLTDTFAQHAKNIGAQIEIGEAVKIGKNGENFEITCKDGKNYLAKSIVLALGTQRRKLNISGEDQFLGKGIAYCATCDGPLYKDKIVGVVGGGNAAVTSAIMLAKYASQVYLFVRDKTLNSEPSWTEEINKNSKIKILLETNIKEIIGDEKINVVNLDKPFEDKNSINLVGLFIEIGAVPAAALCQNLQIELDTNGFIKINGGGATNVAGVFAAGDITTGSAGFAQILTASAEGAVAAHSVFKFLRR